MKYIKLVLVSILAIALSTSARANETLEYQERITEIAQIVSMSTIVATYCLFSDSEMEVALGKDLGQRVLSIVNELDSTPLITDEVRNDIASQIDIWAPLYIQQSKENLKFRASFCQLESFDALYNQLDVIAEMLTIKI
jgi:hypothetical protein